METQYQSYLIVVMISLFVTFGCKTYDNFQVTAFPAKMNILYVGVANPIKIVHALPEKESYLFSTNNGRIVDVSSNTISILPDTLVECLLTLSRQNIKDTFTFRVLQVPDPVVYLTKANSHFPLRNLSDVIGLATYSPSDFAFDVTYEILSFKIKIFGNEDIRLLSYNNDGSQFSEELKSIIQNLNSIEKVKIEQILVMLPDSTLKTIRNIEYSLN